MKISDTAVCLWDDPEFFALTLVSLRYDGLKSDHRDIKGRVGTCWLKDAQITVAVASGEGLHHAVNLLGLTRETETPQELPAKFKMSNNYVKHLDG